MIRKRYLLWILAVALVFTACGKEEVSPTQPPVTTASATEPVETAPPKTVITAVVPRNTQDSDAWWARFEQAYEEANPEFDLEVTCASWHDLDAIVRERIASGTTPDLVNTDSFLAHQMEGRLLPASQWVSQETYDKFYPQLHERICVDGVVWGLPDHVTARALYYNADLLAAAGISVPSTWSELISACQALKAYDASLCPWGVDMTTDEGYACFAYYMWNNGSDFWDSQGSWNLNDPRNLEAVDFIVGMVDDDLTNDDPTWETRYDLQSRFGRGEVAMMIAPSSLPAYCAAEGNTVNYGIAPLPVNGSNPSVSTATGNYWLCFAQEGRSSETLGAISRFMDAFFEDASYAQWVQMEGFLPATTGANALLAQQDPQMQIWDQIMHSLKFFPANHYQWPDIKNSLVTALQESLLLKNSWLRLDTLQKQAMAG